MAEDKLFISDKEIEYMENFHEEYTDEECPAMTKEQLDKFVRVSGSSVSEIFVSFRKAGDKNG